MSYPVAPEGFLETESSLLGGTPLLWRGDLKLKVFVSCSKPFDSVLIWTHGVHHCFVAPTVES